jgi:hypothetical protein
MTSLKLVLKASYLCLLIGITQLAIAQENKKTEKDINWYAGTCYGVFNEAAKRGFKLPQFSQGPRLEMFVDISKKNQPLLASVIGGCGSSEKTDACLDRLNIMDASERNYVKGFVGAANVILKKSDSELKCEVLRGFCDRFTSNFECPKELQ